MKHWEENFLSRIVSITRAFRYKCQSQALTKRGRAPSKKWSGQNLTSRTVGSGPANIITKTHNQNRQPTVYKKGEQYSSGFGRFWECQKCNILVITQALVLCLIYTHSPLGAARPRASCVYIRQSTPACVTTYTYIFSNYATFLSRNTVLLVSQAVRRLPLSSKAFWFWS